MTKEMNDPSIFRRKKNKEYFTENVFFIGFLVFILAIAANYILNLPLAKDFYNWSGLYINMVFSWMVETSKNPDFSNPFTPAVMKIITPWLWITGFFIGSFISGQALTITNIRVIKTNKIFVASLITGVLQLIYYVFLIKSTPSIAFFIALIIRYYVDIIIIIITSAVGLMFGTEYALSLFRNEKIKIPGKNGEPNVSVQFTNDYKW